MSDLPSHGDRGPCARCGREVEVTAIASYVDRTVALCRHVDTGRQECDGRLWDSINPKVTSYAEQGGTLAAWSDT